MLSKFFKRVTFKGINLIEPENNILKPKVKDNFIPDHHSPVRHMVNLANGQSNTFLRNYEKAKKTKSSYIIMEGDWGGQIYLSYPVNLIKCQFDRVEQLLNDINKIEWDDDGEGARIYFEVKKVGDGIAGGMKGGLITDSLWVHSRLEKLKDEIMDVLLGKRVRIDLELHYIKDDED